jgi:hypothetical protein
VISSAGTLGGFSGGLGMKKKLLGLEKETRISSRRPPRVASRKEKAQ